MAVLAATLEHEGKTYDAAMCTIERTMLGREDHGVFMAQLYIDYGGSGTALGGHALDDKPAERKPGSRRLGTAYGMEYIIRLIEVVAGEYGSWENIKGRRVLALFDPEDNSRDGYKCLGVADLDGKRVFLFSDLKGM
jgi:hypothetical protein